MKTGRLSDSAREPIHFPRLHWQPVAILATILCSGSQSVLAALAGGSFRQASNPTSPRLPKKRIQEALNLRGNRNLLHQYDLPDEDLAQLDAFVPEDWFPHEQENFAVNKIVTGRVLEIRGEDVIIDIGYKSEGIIKLEEWKEDGADKPAQPQVGDNIQVLLETLEDEQGTISLSYRKAKRQKEWEAILAKHKEGDKVSGMVTRKIKGGLLVNIGVNVFLPASQADIRRPPDIGDYIGKTIECSILKIDEQRRTIVVSRRKLIEDRRRVQKQKLLEEIKVGDTRTGAVKNIADFGAFVDLGGGDGLLHITDTAWHRITNQHQSGTIDQYMQGD